MAKMTPQNGSAASKSILIINPNSTVSMTDGLRNLVRDHKLDKKTHLSFEYLTAPSGPSSINNEDDGAESTRHCIPMLTEDVLNAHDGFIVACYSTHNLVDWLKGQDAVKAIAKPVFGIFEASVVKSLELIGARERYGIISTGKYWEEALSAGIKHMNIKGAYDKFAGVETTGLNAKELHDVPAGEVQAKLTEATRTLVKAGDVTAVCLGCAGMAGMDETVRKASILELGKEKGERVRIIDGVVAAVELIDVALK